MEHLIKTIAEVKSALDQATQLLDENIAMKAKVKELQDLTTKVADVNTALLKEAQSPTNSNPQRELKVAQIAFDAGREFVLNQLRDSDYETETEIEESCYENGFDITFCKEVEVSIEVNDVLDYLYEEDGKETTDEWLVNEVLTSVDNVLAADELPTPDVIILK